jgi:FAD:protein FMN transferase
MTPSPACADPGWTMRFALMGGEALVRLAGCDAATAEAAAGAVRDEARRIEARYSRYRADSIVGRINAAAGSDRVIEVDEETAALLDFAARLHTESGGLFDVTSGILRQAWDFRRGERPQTPQLGARLASLCARIGWPRVHWDGRAIALPEPGMELDFGGIGKEYAADRCAAVLAGLGLRHGWINLGGDVRVIGPQPDGQPWRIAIRDPRHPRDPQAVAASIEIGDGALATSGDYERFIEIDGQRFGHILDPRTGWPVRHWQSVSVRAPLCVAAGAMATVAMLQGADAPAWLNAQGVRWLAIDAEGRLHTEAGTEAGTEAPPAGRAPG